MELFNEMQKKNNSKNCHLICSNIVDYIIANCDETPNELYASKMDLIQGSIEWILV